MVSTTDPLFPRRITSIDLVSADGGESEGGLFDQLASYPTVRRAMGEADELTLELLPGCSTYMAGLLKPRKLLTVNYDDGSFERWRVSEVRLATEAPGEATLKALPIWTDLAYSTMRRSLAPTGQAQLHVVMTGLTVPQLLAEILSPAWACPEGFSAGTVAAKFANTVVTVEGTGLSHLEALRQVCEKAGCEWEMRWHSTEGWKIDVVEQIGWSQQEKDAGAAMPDLRPMMAPTGGHAASRGNRLSLHLVDSSETYFNRIIPTAGDEEFPSTIARAEFVATLVEKGQPSAHETRITLEGSPIATDGLLRDRVRIGKGTNADGEAAGTFYPVAMTYAPNVVIVAAADPAIVAGERLRFVDYGPQGEAVDLVALYLDHPLSGNGTSEKTVRFTDVAPEVNLIRDKGWSDDMAVWGVFLLQGGGSIPVPQGFGPVGAATIEENTLPLYTSIGGKSAKVTAAAGEGIQTEPIALAFAADRPYASIWSKLYVASGSVKLELVDEATGLALTPEIADTNAKAAELSIGGLKPPAGTYRVRVTAKEAGTVFYLDALTFVNESAPVPWRQHMGPRALFEHAGRYLVANGGYREASYEGELLDAAYFDTALAEVKLGSWCRVKDVYDAQRGAWAIDFAARVVETLEDEDPATGRVRKQVRLSKNLIDITDRFLTASGAPSVATGFGGGLAPTVVIDTADKVKYVNAASGLTGENVQAALDELASRPSSGGGGAGPERTVVFSETIGAGDVVRILSDGRAQKGAYVPVRSGYRGTGYAADTVPPVHARTAAVSPTLMVVAWTNPTTGATWMRARESKLDGFGTSYKVTFGTAMEILPVTSTRTNTRIMDIVAHSDTRVTVLFASLVSGAWLLGAIPVWLSGTTITLQSPSVQVSTEVDPDVGARLIHQRGSSSFAVYAKAGTRHVYGRQISCSETGVTVRTEGTIKAAAVAKLDAAAPDLNPRENPPGTLIVTAMVLSTGDLVATNHIAQASGPMLVNEVVVATGVQTTGVAACKAGGLHRTLIAYGASPSGGTASLHTAVVTNYDGISVTHSASSSVLTKGLLQAVPADGATMLILHRDTDANASVRSGWLMLTDETSSSYQAGAADTSVTAAHASIIGGRIFSAWVTTSGVYTSDAWTVGFYDPQTDRRCEIAGVALESGVAGESRRIALFGAVTGGYTGLQPGWPYYASEGARPVSYTTAFPIGIAVSPTDLLLTKNP